MIPPGYQGEAWPAGRSVSRSTGRPLPGMPSLPDNRSPGLLSRRAPSPVVCRVAALGPDAHAFLDFAHTGTLAAIANHDAYSVPLRRGRGVPCALRACTADKIGRCRRNRPEGQNLGSSVEARKPDAFCGIRWHELCLTRIRIRIREKSLRKSREAHTWRSNGPGAPGLK